MAFPRIPATFPHMKPSLLVLPLLGLLSGCDLGEHSLTAENSPATDIATVAESSGVASGTNSNSLVSAVAPAVRPPTAPPDLPPPVQEVVRLAQTTLGDGVLLGYVAKISEPYSLSADQIIYLNDLGLSDPVIQSLVQHASGTAAMAPEPSMAQTVRAGPAPTAPPTVSGSPGVIQNYLTSTAPGSEMGTPVAPSVQYNTAPPTNYVTIQAPEVAPTPEIFQESLSPYGAWVDVPDYGYVWQPTVAVVNPDWRPYCDNGSWVWTDCGWYWSSGYSWGWAPFHYGRWCYAPHHGWCWAPDRCWGPAWVTWRSCDSHCGWAPLPPHCVWSPTVGFTYYGRHVGVGFGFDLGPSAFVYVGWNHFCDPHPWRHCATRTEVVSLHPQSRVINDVRGNGNTVVNVRGNNNTVIINNGPGIAPVQAHSKTEIPRMTVASVQSPQRQAPGGRAAGGIVAAYRPNLDAGTPASSPAAWRGTQTPGSNPANSATAPTGRPYLGANLVRQETPTVSRPGTGTYNTPYRPTQGVVNGMTPSDRTSPRPVGTSSNPTQPYARSTPNPTGVYHPREVSTAQGPVNRAEVAPQPARTTVSADRTQQQASYPNRNVEAVVRPGNGESANPVRPPTGIFAPSGGSPAPGSAEAPTSPLSRAPGYSYNPATTYRYAPPAYHYTGQFGNSAPAVRYYSPAPQSGPVNSGGSHGSSGPASAPASGHPGKSGH